MSNKDLDLIYNALDRGDYAKAQQICERPDVGKYTITQALLAYTYASQRKYEKAMELGRRILQSEPFDESTVNALGCTFKLCRSDPDFATCYENAIKKNIVVPPHFHSELFYCYLRMNEIKKMQSVAQRAYKSTDNPRYVAWMVTCILLQKDLPKQMLAVAEKMMRKIFDEIRVAQAAGAEELLLFTNILYKQGKLLESWEYLQQLIERSKDSGLPLESDNEVATIKDEDHFKENSQLVVTSKQQRLFLLLDLYSLTNQLQLAVGIAYEVLDELPDQWNVYELLHRLAFTKLRSEKSTVFERKESFTSFAGLLGLEKLKIGFQQSAEYNPQLYRDFLVRMIQKYPKVRGPRLAQLYCLLEVLQVTNRDEVVDLKIDLTLDVAQYGHDFQAEVDKFLELWKGTIQRGLKVPQDLAAFIFHLLIYVETFKTKHCLFADIKPILFNLSERQLHQSHSLLNEWTSAQLTKLIHSGEFKKLFRPTVSKNDTADTTVLVGVAEEDEVIDEEAGIESIANAVGSIAIAKKLKKKSSKKKKNSAKHVKANVGDATREPNISKNEEKRLDIDFSHVNQVGKKDNEAVAIVCTYSQYDTIRSYCLFLEQKFSNGGGTISSLTDEAVINRQKIYKVLCHRFQEGVNGEARTIQPGDDLISLVSAIYYDRLQSYFERSEYDEQSVRLANEWLRIVQSAVQSSPFNAKLKIDLLEIARYLGITSSATFAFQNLGVKHIQYDSLSYLVLPNYLEGAFWAEALQLYRNVLSFHKVCHKECTEMLGKGFEFSNYYKILEIFQFIADCQSSLQLYLAKAEIPILELAIDSLPTFEKAKGYILSLIEEKKFPEYLPYLEESELSLAISHLDTKIINRFQSSTNVIELRKEDKARECEIAHRIKLAQDLLYGFYALAKKDVESARKYQKRLIENFLFFENDGGKPSLRFSQEIDNTGSVSKLNWYLISQWMQFGILVLSLADEESVASIITEIANTEQRIFDYFLSSSEISVSFVGEEDHFFFSPNYLRSLSTFGRTSRVWIPLLMELIISFAPNLRSTCDELFMRWKDFTGKLKTCVLEASNNASVQQEIEHEIVRALQEKLFLTSNLKEDAFPNEFFVALQDLQGKNTDFNPSYACYRDSLDRIISLL